MKFIPPLEIASKIMTLIDDAEKNLIIVSPYVEMTNWEKMKKCLSKCLKKGVNIKFIIRKNVNNNDLFSLRQLNIQPIFIQDLHAKVYINDNYAIVTSLNITHYSDINSIDIAYQTETEVERTELIDYVNKHITNVKSVMEKVTPIESEIKPIAENIIQNIEKQSNVALTQLTDFEINSLCQFFKDNFPYSTFKTTSSYVFSGNLIPFSDIMISTNYIIKFKKSLTGSEQILNKIIMMNFSLIHKQKIDVLTSHKTHYYIEYIPIGKIDLVVLQEDFIKITSKILDSNVFKAVKN